MQYVKLRRANKFNDYLNLEGLNIWCRGNLREEIVIIAARTCSTLTFRDWYNVTPWSRSLDAYLSFELRPRIWLLSSILVHLRRDRSSARNLLIVRLFRYYRDFALLTRLSICRRRCRLCGFRHTLFNREKKAFVWS